MTENSNGYSKHVHKSEGEKYLLLFEKQVNFILLKDASIIVLKFNTGTEGSVFTKTAYSGFKS